MAVSCIFLLLAVGGWWLLKEKSGTASQGVFGTDAGIYANLPFPDSPLELVSPIQRIKHEIDAMSTALDLYNRAKAVDQESSTIQFAIESIAKRFHLLASAPLVKANKSMRDKVAAGIVASAGVTVKNRQLLAELVRLNNVDWTVTVTRLQMLLDEKTLSDSERETLLFELASLSAEQKIALNRDLQISALTDTFANAIAQKVKKKEFDKATRMTELALLIDPQNVKLNALRTHLENGKP